MIDWVAQAEPSGAASAPPSVGGDPEAGARADLRRSGILHIPPAQLEVPSVGGEATVEEVLRASLAGSVNRLLAQDPGVRHSRAAEPVHQARVATRRLRSNLGTYRSVLSPDWTDSLRRELDWLGAMLGEARDLDVLREHLVLLAEALPVKDRPATTGMLIEIERRREAARAGLLAAMQDARYAMLVDRLVEAASSPVTTRGANRPATEALPSLMARPWHKLRAAMKTLGVDSPDEELHAARIRAKRARYAAESMEPIFGARAEAFADAASDLQTVLGDCHDAVLAERWLRSLAGIGTDASVAFAAGSLATLARAEGVRHRGLWPAEWKRLRRKRLRFWT